jgi:hypothetical protein
MAGQLPFCASSRSAAHQSRASGSRAVANVWHNAIASVQKLWQREERTNDGQHARCSRVLYHQFPLERQASLIQEKWHVVQGVGNVQAENVGGVSLREKLACPDYPMAKKPAQRGFTEAI